MTNVEEEPCNRGFSSFIFGGRHALSLREAAHLSFHVGERGLAVIQQRYDPETKHTFWAEVDEWLTDPLYLHPRFRAFFDRRAGTGTDGLYPTVTIRQIMWALKMKPLPKQPWETVFDHTPI